MQPRALKLLEDVRLAGEDILEFTAGKTLADYKADRILRLAIERSFTIIGEALRRLRDEDPVTLSKITDSNQIIGFRNVIIHGYDIIKDDAVWDTIREDLPKLVGEVRILIESEERNVPT